MALFRLLLICLLSFATGVGVLSISDLAARQTDLAYGHLPNAQFRVIEEITGEFSGNYRKSEHEPATMLTIASEGWIEQSYVLAGRDFRSISRTNRPVSVTIGTRNGEPDSIDAEFWLCAWT